MVDPIAIPFQLLGNISSRLRTSEEVETDLNERFGGRERDIMTYEGDTVTLRFSSISVRPRIDLGGIKEPAFAWGENFPGNPGAVDKIRAILTDDWLTIVRFSIEGGDFDDLHPRGFNFGFASHVSSSAVANSDMLVTRMIRVSTEPEVYSRRLITRIPFNGQIGEYTEELSKVVENVQYMQDNMKEISFNLLMNLYSTTDEEWKDEERARALASFLFEERNFDSIESLVDKLWREGSTYQSDVKAED